jgi:hypothetical protein
MAPPFLDSGQSAVLPEPPRRADKRDRKTPEAVRVGPANHNCRFLLFTFLFSFFFFLVGLGFGALHLQTGAL